MIFHGKRNGQSAELWLSSFKDFWLRYWDYTAFTLNFGSKNNSDGNKGRIDGGHLWATYVLDILNLCHLSI